MKIGAQLYTLRAFTQTERDFARSMEKLAALGYGAVQISGVGDIPPQRLREICDGCGLRVPLTHTNTDKVLRQTQAVIADHKTLGAEYVGVAGLGSFAPTAAGAVAFARAYAPAARAIREAGLQFMYHNHDREFEKTDGVPLLDRLNQGLEGLAGFTLDVFWVQAAGGDPAWWLEHLAGKVDCVHLKDYAMVQGQRRFAEIFEGNMNWGRIFDACQRAGVRWAFVEQDDCYGQDPFGCLGRSLENIRRFTAYGTD